MHLLYPLKILHNHCFQFFLGIAVISSQDKLQTMAMPDFSKTDLGGGCRGCAPPLPEITCGFLIQMVFCKKKTMWFIGAAVEQETSASPPKKNPGSASGNGIQVLPRE